MSEPGLDLHEWETRWQELQDAAAEAPDEALPDVVRFVSQMLVERGYQLDEPVTKEGDDLDIVKDLLAAQEIAEAAETRGADPEDVATALDDLQEIYDYLVSDRAPP
ncbi:MAG: hypothetical protein ACXVRZ_13980 [Gaiellaceae bacterium]